MAGEFGTYFRPCMMGSLLASCWGLHLRLYLWKYYVVKQGYLGTTVILQSLANWCIARDTAIRVRIS